MNVIITDMKLRELIKKCHVHVMYVPSACAEEMGVLTLHRLCISSWWTSLSVYPGRENKTRRREMIPCKDTEFTTSRCLYLSEVEGRVGVG